MKTIDIEAGKRTRIIQKFSNSLAETYDFEVEPLESGDVISGIVEVKGSNWLFPKPAVTQNLDASTSVEKGVWDTIYSVYIIPDVDVRVNLAQANFSKMWPIVVFAFAVTGIALAIFLGMGNFG